MPANPIQNKPEGVLLRTLLSAAGVAPGSNGKPIIGVATLATQTSVDRPAASLLTDEVIRGIQELGGVPMRWETVRTPDFAAYEKGDFYPLPWRDQAADLIESWAGHETLDALVLIGDAPETLAGMAMAATRLNAPAILLPVSAYPSIVTLTFEALGLCLAGASTAALFSTKQKELALLTGRRAVELVQAGHNFKRILSTNAFTNAIRFTCAMGGSLEALIHLSGLAHEAGLNITPETFEKISRETPHVCRLAWPGDKKPITIQDLDAAGGVWAVMHAIRQHILPTATLHNKGAAELAKVQEIRDSKVIAGTRPYAKQSGVGYLKGNFATKGAFYLLAQSTPDFSKVVGPVLVFDYESSAIDAVNAGKFKKGQILIVRNQGAKGGPGLRRLTALPALLEKKGLNKKIALVTDGRLPNTPSGLFISLVAPEGAVAGPLAVLRDGDIVEIDLAAKAFNVRLTEMDLRLRLTRWKAPEAKIKSGFLERYSRLVSEAYEGAVLK